MRRKLSRCLIFATLASIAGAQPLSYVPGRILVKFHENISDAQARVVLASLSARSDGVVGSTGVHIVQLPSAGNEQSAVNAFKGRPEVQFAELDRIVPPADVIPNDLWYQYEWHLPKISAPTAWSATTGTASVVIAIIDTGVDATHEDLASKMVLGWNTYANNSNTSDVYGHGTQVAGTAAAVSNNGLGVASVCWNCMIMPIVVSDSTGAATYSSLAAGTTWAADHGARVANISYVVSDSSTVTAAAQYFQNKGGVVTSSAGNYATFDSSSDNPYILTISATDPNDNLYSWSNTGNNIDLAAPGCVYSTANGGGYTSGCGTSFSAPIVAAVAGLMFSLNPSLSPSQVITILRQTADDVGSGGWDPSFGWGRVNAARAVGAGSSVSIVPAVSFESPQNGATISGTASVQVLAADSAGIASVSFYADNVLIGTKTVSPYTWSWNSTSATNGGHLLMAIAQDVLGNGSSATSSVTVSNKIADNASPTVVIASPGSGTIVSMSQSVSVTASDNIGVASVDLLVDNAAVATDTAAPYTYKVNTKKWTSGTHTLQARAHDAAGNVGLSAVVTVYK